MRILVAIIFAWLPLVADGSDEALREGSVFAVVEINAVGDMQVKEIHGDLPASSDEEIRNWLLRQPLVLPTAGDERRIMKIDYRIFEMENAAPYLALEIVDTDARLPADASAEQVVEVEVHLLANGNVQSVRPLGELPEGISQEALTETVRENIENDPRIMEAAENDSLRESTQTITVKVRPRNE